MSETPAAGGFDLRVYGAVLRRRRFAILGATVVVVLAALASLAFQSKRYTASATLLLQPSVSETLVDPTSQGQTVAAQNVATEIEVINSAAVRQVVMSQLGADIPGPSISQVGQTSVVRVSVNSTDKSLAAAVANAYAKAYIDFRRNQTVDGLLAASREVQREVDGLQKQIDTIDGQLATATTTTRDSLNAQRTALVNQIAAYNQRITQFQLDSRLSSGGAHIVTPAAIPGTPSEPRPLRTGAVAVFVGLLFGTGLAFLLEHFDDTIETKEDLEYASSGQPVLGLIPVVPGWRDSSNTYLVSKESPRSQVAEAYRSLRTSVQFMSLEKPLRVLQVTSPLPGEGKSATAANLGIVFATTGLRVALLDCDLRRPRLHKFFGLANDLGFTSLLIGEADRDAVIRPVAAENRLHVVTSGPIPPNPSELLDSKRATEFIQLLAEGFDLVIIDSPPVIPVTDALVLSSVADATLLIASAGLSSRRDIARSVELLAQVDAPLAGCVLNRVHGRDGYGYRYGSRYKARYGYRYGYGDVYGTTGPEPGTGTGTGERPRASVVGRR